MKLEVQSVNLLEMGGGDYCQENVVSLLGTLVCNLWSIVQRIVS